MEKSKEIDIIALVAKVIGKPKLLVAFVAVSAVVGVVVALSTPKTYSASVVLAPEISGGGLGISESLADMASNFGVDLASSGKGMDAIYPEIYPEIFASTDFILTLFDVPVRTKDSDSLRTYIHHITKEAKAPFWDYPKMWISEMLKPKEKAGGAGKNDPFKISREMSEICDGVIKNISCMVDKKTSIITISISDQDPLVAAIMADTLQLRLQDYITQYRTQKARVDYEYYKTLYTESNAKYKKAQKIYADFCDANQDVVLERYRAKRDELENNMQTAFTTMNQLNTQVQTSEAKIQERTPSFTILSAAKMSHKAASTPRAFIVILYMLLGAMADVVWVCFLKDYIRKYRKNRQK